MHIHINECIYIHIECIYILNAYTYKRMHTHMYIQNTIILSSLPILLVHYLQDSEQSLLAIMGCTRGKKRNTHTMTTEEREETCQRMKT